MYLWAGAGGMYAAGMYAVGARSHPQGNRHKLPRRAQPTKQPRLEKTKKPLTLRTDATNRGREEELQMDSATDSMALDCDKLAPADFNAVRREIADEYLQEHQFPWIVGYSGGKDSTLVAHLVFEALMNLPPDKRTRPVHIIANDTLVESPMVVGHIRESLEEIKGVALTLRRF